jgi:hypothetical protein
MASDNRQRMGIHLDLDGNQLLNTVLHRIASFSELSHPTGGQVYFDTALDQPFYINNGGVATAIANCADLVGGNVSGQIILIATNSLLLPTGNGIVSANEFNRFAVVPIIYGGTSATGFVNGGVLVGQGTGVFYNNSSGLFFDITNGRLGVGTPAPSAYLHIGGNSGSAPLYIFPRSLFTTPRANHFEFDGSGFYYTTEWGSRRTLATTSDSLADSFTGVLPISRGGTNNNGFTNGSLVLASGSTLISLVGSGVNSVPEWDGNKWISSASGYITTSPTTNRNTITAQNILTIPLTLRGTSTTGYVLRIMNSGNQEVGGFNTSGNVYVANRVNFHQNNASGTAYISIVAVSGILAPYIKMNAVRDLLGNRYTAGFIDTSADSNGINASGGFINTAGGSNAAGGSINTSDGGGSISTRGSGFIELGASSPLQNRTTIIGGATGGDKIIRIPNQSGWFPVVNGPFTSGAFVKHDGAKFVMATGSTGGGITSLNAQTGATQTFATGHTGTDFSITSSADIHTLNIPIATGATVRYGLLSSGDWNTFNNKLSTSHITADDHTQYIINRPSTSGRNYLWSSGTVPALTIQESTPNASTLFYVRSSGGTNLFSVGSNGAIAYTSMSIYNGTAFTTMQSDATSNNTNTFPDLGGTILVSNATTTGTQYAAFAHESIPGAITFAEIADPMSSKRIFGVYVNATATTRSTIGMVALGVTTPGAAISSRDTTTAPWQRITSATSAGSPAQFNSANMYYLGWEIDSYTKFKLTSNPSGMLVFCGYMGSALSVDTDLPNPEGIDGGIYLVYDHTLHGSGGYFFQLVRNIDSSSVPSFTTTTIPVTSGIEHTVRFKTTANSVQVFYNDELKNTLTNNLPTGILLTYYLGVHSKDASTRTLDFSWYQGRHK